MRRNALLADVAIAAVLAILVIVIAPGLAVVGLLAILVIVICAITFAVDRRRSRRPARIEEIRVSRRQRG